MSNWKTGHAKDECFWPPDACRLKVLHVFLGGSETSMAFSPSLARDNGLPSVVKNRIVETCCQITSAVTPLPPQSNAMSPRGRTRPPSPFYDDAYTCDAE